ncbi:type IV pilus modification PilV family protein [Pseudoalteromonas luteoviolacea]|uniref:Prepilin-type N-terminal cleavage/methylation domain-containing protein n=1 Tax=Pseudoalteromonas luteoviolacea S4054 TaxID=1129367 RepID=A0A0F6AD57_9GAMM|nr:prepilin-type N-terminal cleavage/methylation domain-containing protein [Pseudoalteromonas luteoviolacea]AOT06677.1 hypothetical protein S4054249_01720 [Pseudoalteromonas luteoviolacea]AOT11595.1 hypothetical protein S40542_01720 [Pseudoalteromonas luteoviolacea]AOT16507.1 hypothetical protein S4054_01720 [Pseudoalteromonas luteoviolacea]KKE83761.1 hypothetical protein N479_12265 [Pseudoalteromonas luteoviolacea S4054]KZN73956.1 hypothetical protein N481_10990 [Pseudoalteromonas luteoviolac
MRIEKGFSLIEVMVSIVIAGVALLGLAGAQLKSLQFASNSFNYTVALVQGQNAIERMWTDLCHFEHVNQSLVVANNQKVANLYPADDRYQLSIFPTIYNDAATPAADRRDVRFTVSWQDERVKDTTNALNQITLVASYVHVPTSPCS